MIRALLSASTFPLHPDDLRPRFVYDLAEALADSCQVSALVPDAPGARREDRMGRVEVHRFTYFLPRRAQILAYGHGMTENLRNRPLSWFQAPPYVLALAFATRRLVARRGIEVVNAHWMIPQGLAVAMARGRQGRFRHVLSVHAADVYLLARLPLGRALARYVLERTDAVFADGSHVAERLDRLLGYPAGAVIQPMGAHLELFQSAPPLAEGEVPFSDGYLLFFGRFSEKKGVVYLLRALPRILERRPGLGLVVIGYGALEEELRAEASRLGVAAATLFAGRRPHAEIASYLRSCRLAVVPSIVDSNGDTEGMPTVVVEAMSAGVRVVASAVDGIPDVVRHGENGWLCREKDPEDLAEKILDALADPPGSVVERGIVETAERFSWPRVAQRYHETFERLLADPTGGS
jgi:glycosyltransferase involved in cell wall biosynthesis